MRADYTLDAVPREADCWHFVEYLLSADGHKALAAHGKGEAADDERLSIQASPDHLIANRAGLFECFRCFARRNRNQHRLKAR